MKSSRYSRALLSIIFVSLLGSAATKALRPLFFVEVGADPVQLGLLMARALRNVVGVKFTEFSKEAMATCLKEQMRGAVCPICG